VSWTSWSELLAAEDSRTARRAQLRISLGIRTAARVVALPAVIAMLYALFMFWRETWPFPRGAGATMWTIASTTTVPVDDLFASEDFLAPNWWMSIGLLALIALPGVNVALVLWESLRLRRWVDTLAAGGVLAILILGVLSGQG
jgi:hypothetical protein